MVFSTLRVASTIVHFLGMINLEVIHVGMIDWLIGRIDRLPTKNTDKKIMDFAAERRIITTGPRQGNYDPEYTKYLIEPINALSIGSTTQRVIVVKATQGGWTTGGENLLGYFMIEYPADVLYISGTQELLKRWGERKLEQLIDSLGIRDRIRSFKDTPSSKKSGDTTYRKVYSGCVLDLVSARSAASLRAEDKQVLFRDEIDSAPRVLVTGEGDYLAVSGARVDAYGDRKKIYDISTPTTGESLIWQEYLLGDCRKYNVQCRSCGEYQDLDFGEEDGEKKTHHGLKGDYDKTWLKDVYYQCRHCNDRILESEKPRLIRTGFWKPTREASLEYTQSYADNSLIRPIDMLSWRSIYEEWKQAKRDPIKMVSFTNLRKGLPYEDDRSRPRIESVLANKSNYGSWTVHEDALFITAGADVQKGSEYGPDKGPRIEIEVLGHGRGYRTYSVGYKVFRGSVEDPFDGAWQKFYQWILDTRLSFERKDGTPMSVDLGFIDSGYRANIVYRFCKRLKGFYPSKGFQDLKLKKGDRFKRDMPTGRDKVKFRVVKLTSTFLYEIATVFYKDVLYNNMLIKRSKGDIQSPGFCEFPNDYDQSYFKELLAEEKSSEDGSYSARGRKNEALDCRVMCLCSGDAYLDGLIQEARDCAKQSGMSEIQIREQIDTPYILRVLEKRLYHRIANARMKRKVG